MFLISVVCGKLFFWQLLIWTLGAGLAVVSPAIRPSVYQLICLSGNFFISNFVPWTTGPISTKLGYVVCKMFLKVRENTDPIKYWQPKKKKENKTSRNHRIPNRGGSGSALYTPPPNLNLGCFFIFYVSFPRSRLSKWLWLTMVSLPTLRNSWQLCQELF